MPPLRLLGRSSSINVRKVLWTLSEIGAPFVHEAEWATPDKPSSSPAFKALNPNGLVPVIQDENGVLWESNTICRYLAAKHGRDDLLPPAAGDTLAARAQVEKWMDWQSTNLNAAYRYAFLALVRRAPTFTDQASIARSNADWNAAMSILDGHLSMSGDYVCGETFTLADIVLALATHRWLHTPIERVPLPHVDRWMTRLQARDGVAAFLNPDVP